MAFLGEIVSHSSAHDGVPVLVPPHKEKPYALPHRSLLTSLPCTQGEGSLMQYSGTLGSAIDDLGYFLRVPEYEKDLVALVTHPALITRALVELNIADGGSEVGEDLIRESCRAMQAVYSADSDAFSVVSTLSERIVSQRGNVALDTSIVQPGDIYTWEATDPVRSEGSAQLLGRMFQGKPLLFIPLAHGGLMAGMDIFLYYQGITGFQDGAYYPLRFSMHKKKDKAPHFSVTELAYLQQQAVGREIVIFEEDVHSGNTHRDAKAVAEWLLFPNREITMLTNCTIGKQIAVNYNPRN